MSIQNIIDKAEEIAISRNTVSGSTLSRGGRLRSAAVAGNVPYRFSVSYAPYQTYADSRATIEEIERLDLVHSETVDIGSTNAGLSWVTAYQGDMSAVQIANLSLTGTYTGNTIDVDTANVTGSSSSDILFKKGDYISFDSGYVYPYTVTADVQIGSVAPGSNVSVPVHRPIISQTGYTFAGKGVLVGNDVTWRVRMISKPTYRLIPGRYVAWSGEFVLMEQI